MRLCGCAEQRIDCLAPKAFEKVSSQSAIGFHVPHNWLHRIFAFELSMDLRCYCTPGTRDPDFQVLAGAAIAPVAPVCVSLLGAWRPRHTHTAPHMPGACTRYAVAG